MSQMPNPIATPRHLRGYCDFLPPRVGLYLVIFRRYAWYFTTVGGKLVSIVIEYRQPSRILLALPHSVKHLETGVKRTLCAEELSRDIQILGPHYYDLLAVE